MDKYELNVQQTVIDSGATQPFKLLHIADTHLTFADLRDGARKTMLAARRAESFKNAYEFIQTALEYARVNSMSVLHTGDLIDFVSQKNLEAVSKLTAGRDFYMAAGNHEFSLYVGEAFEDDDYKSQSFDAVQMRFSDNLRFQSRIKNGVNIVTLDNSYYQIRQAETQRLRQEIEKGLPIVLCVHNPFYERTLYDYIIKEKGEQCACLVCCPESMVSTYPQDKFVQQRADGNTREFYDLLNNTSLVKAVIAGHIHENFQSRLPGGAMQYVTGLTCRGNVRELTFI